MGACWVIMTLCVTLGRALPPRNVYLADSAFPICHGDTWCSDSSPLPGPASGNASHELLFHPLRPTELADPISLVYGPDGVVWGSSTSHIMRIEIADKMAVVAEFLHNSSFEFHGAYSLVTAENTYFASDMASISAYRLVRPADKHSPIERAAVYPVPGCVDGEHLVGLSMAYDGSLVFATSAGRVGVVSQDFARAATMLQLPGRDVVKLPLKMVSNNFAVDQNNGIYIVTSMHQHRLQWQPATFSLTVSVDLCGTSPAGSGSSPTIVSDSDEPRLVVITDGTTPMHLRFYDTASGYAMAWPLGLIYRALCGATPVIFPGLGNSTSEQSVVVAGLRAMVVNNWWDGPAYKSETFGSEWIQHICPALLGAAAFGVAQYAVDPVSCAVTQTWVNTEVSCTSAIPVVSLPDSRAYCLGKRGPMFTIEALDWLSGRSLFHVPLGEGLQYNRYLNTPADADSLYAGTEIGPLRDVVMGTMAGILRVKAN